MSKYVSYKTEFKDEQLLIEALAALGYTAEYHENGVTTKNNFGETNQKVQIIVRQEELRRVKGTTVNLPADLGFKKDKNGVYTAVINDYDRVHNKQGFVDQVNEQYAIAGAKRTAKRLGLRFVKAEKKKGVTRMVYLPA